MAGAIIRVPVHIAELSATAFIITDLSIRLGYKACLAGWSKALMAPARKARAITCQAWITPAKVKPDKINMSAPFTVWVMLINFFRSSLSANTPPKMFKTIAGTAFANPTYPRYKGDSVNSRMIQNWLKFNIWKPITEAKVPSQ